MKGTPATLKALSAAIEMEAHLCAQYRINCHELKRDGVKGLRSKFKDWKSDACDWVERATHDMLLVDGDPTYTVEDLVQYSTVKEMLSDALALETEAYDFYTEQAPLLRKAGDEAEGHVFQHFSKWHREHIREIETEIAVLTKLGDISYMVSRS